MYLTIILVIKFLKNYQALLLKSLRITIYWRTYNATSSDIYYFFLDYVDVDYYAESKMNKNADENNDASDDDYDYY